MRHARMALAVGLCLGLSGCAQTRWQTPQPGSPARFQSTPQAWNSSAIHSRPAGQVAARFYPAFAPHAPTTAEPRNPAWTQYAAPAPRAGAWYHSSTQDSIALAQTQRSIALRQIAGTPPPSILAVALKADVTPAADHAVAMARSDSPAPEQSTAPAQSAPSADSIVIPPDHESILPPATELALSAPDSPAPETTTQTTPANHDTPEPADQLQQTSASPPASSTSRPSAVALALASAAQDLAQYAQAQIEPAPQDHDTRVAASQALAADADSHSPVPPIPPPSNPTTDAPAPGYAQVPGVPTSPDGNPTPHPDQSPPTADTLHLEHDQPDNIAGTPASGSNPARPPHHPHHCPRCHHNHPPQTNPRNGLLARLGKLRFQDRQELTPSELPQAQFPRTYYDAVPRPADPNPATAETPDPAEPIPTDRWAWLRFWERRKS